MKSIIAAELSPELAARFKRLSQAAGAPRTRLLRAAIEDFIEKTIAENANIREKFERYTLEDEARAARAAAPTRGHLTVIK